MLSPSLHCASLRLVGGRKLGCATISAMPKRSEALVCKTSLSGFESRRYLRCGVRFNPTRTTALQPSSASI